MIKNYLSILAENGELILAEIAVAPLVGAWIETCLGRAKSKTVRSLPSWERGLKPVWERGNYVVGESLPSWERGLKQKDAQERYRRCRRSPRGSVD